MLLHTNTHSRCKVCQTFIEVEYTSEALQGLYCVCPNCGWESEDEYEILQNMFPSLEGGVEDMYKRFDTKED